MTKAMIWLSAGALLGVAAAISWFTIGWVAPVVLAVSALACLTIGVVTSTKRGGK